MKGKTLFDQLANLLRYPFNYLFLFAFATNASQLSAQDIDDGNLRERCRLEVGGAYLSLYGDLEHLTNMTRYLPHQVRDLEKSLTQADADLEKARLKRDQDLYSVERMQAVKDIESKRAALAETLSDTRQQLAKTQVELLSVSQHKAKLEASIRKFWRIKSIPGFGFGYRFQVDYPHSCPAFDTSCPLTLEEIKQLEEAFQGESSFPKSCVDFMAASKDERSRGVLRQTLQHKSHR
jgi:hypothetical protein